MKFDVYGRFQLEVLREKDTWAVYRLALGKRSFAHDVIIPPEVEPHQIATFLDDLFHEGAAPGTRVQQLEEP